MTDATIKVACLLIGGPTLFMPMRGKLWPFEMHPYMGPCPLSPKKHKPLNTHREPPGFWDAWERFDLGGRVIDGTTCVVPEWCEVCERSGYESEKRMVIGPCNSCNGKRVLIGMGEKTC
jgi:hypothetical protein